MSVLSIQSNHHYKSGIFSTSSVRKEWEIAGKSRPSLDTMMSLCEQTHCDIVSRYTPCESDWPWQYPEPWYGQSLVHLQIEPVGQSKVWYFPLQFLFACLLPHHWAVPSCPKTHVLAATFLISDQTSHSAHSTVFNFYCSYLSAQH